MIKFYFHHTPNPRKVALALEEMGLAYEVVPVDTYKGEQHTPAFRKINPNGKLPAIEDDGVAVFDSSAILLYLAEKSSQFLGAPGDRAALLSWLMFIGTGLGPFSGQAVHFSRVHADSAYATNRYRREVERHYEVLNDRLAVSEFIASDDYTIADMSAWGWVALAGYILGDDKAMERWPHLKRWFQSVDARPAAARAREVGKDLNFKSEFDEETMRAMFPQNFSAAV
jgi:GST-like protein